MIHSLEREDVAVEDELEHNEDNNADGAGSKEGFGSSLDAE